jgi:uncharacterized membrane protein YkvA (DUF1232 family)
MPLTRGEVINALGQVDDCIIAQVIATGATREELAEARAWTVNDESMMNIGRRLPAGRVGDLVEILRQIEEEEFDTEERSL